jgi:hypothetical protein
MTKKQGYSLAFLSFYASFSKIEKSAKNGRKVMAIALLSCHFRHIFQKLKNRLKMDEKLRLLLLFIQKHDLFTGIAGMVISIGSKINV